MKLMLDTNVLIEIIAPGEHKNTKEWFRRILLAPSRPELLISVLVEYELRRAALRKGAARSLEHFEEMVKALTVVPLSAEAARHAVSLSSSTPIADADAIVAAQAIGERAVLVTADAVFRTVQGLEARHWSEVDPERLADLEPHDSSTSRGA